MAFGRYFTHAVVLLIAVVLSGYATVDRHLPASLFLRLGSVNAEGLVLGQGGQVSGVDLGRLSTIMKPLSAPTGPIKSHSAFVHVVKDGESLASIAKTYGVSVEDIRWSNSSLEATDWVGGGDALLMPPVPGIVVVTHPGDSLASVAATYKADPQAIIDFNYIRDPNNIPAGTQLVVPNGQGGLLTLPQPISSGPAVAPTYHGGRYKVTIGGSLGPYRNSRFYFGYCTWYVATWRNVTWMGDAWEWFGNAQKQGVATGQTPQKGAIMVTWESSWGHVAYVESVNPDGSYVVSEMNFAGFDVIDQRVITPGSVPLIGFIY